MLIQWPGIIRILSYLQRFKYYLLYEIFLKEGRGEEGEEDSFECSADPVQ